MTATMKCPVCEREIYKFKPEQEYQGHYWGCSEQSTQVVLMKIAERLDTIGNHLNC